MIKLVKKISFIILLFSTLNSTAQNIEGKVLEILQDGSKSPIFGANVYWEGTSVGTTTNINGEYSIQQPPSLPATLNVSYVGHSLESKELMELEIKEQILSWSYVQITQPM